jgi:hypothetical protein
VLRNSHKHDSVGDHRTNGANPVVEHGVVQADEVTNEGGSQEESQFGEESGAVAKNTTNPVAKSDLVLVSALDQAPISRPASSSNHTPASPSDLTPSSCRAYGIWGEWFRATHGSIRPLPV